jgi:hypothetical protein
MFKNSQKGGQTSSTKITKQLQTQMVKHRQNNVVKNNQKSGRKSSNTMICLVGPPGPRIGPPTLNL